MVKTVKKKKVCVHAFSEGKRAHSFLQMIRFRAPQYYQAILQQLRNKKANSSKTTIAPILINEIKKENVY